MADLQHYQHRNAESGQSMVEYALILVLVILGFGLALAATGPAIANVFSNVVFNQVVKDRLAPGVTPPSAADFWATMTWVATQTPGETPLATRTLQPPSSTPTDGPSPTPTPITPTNTPTNTPTITPTPTPRDYDFVAPWTDSANDKIYWRLDNFDVGTEDWYGQYFPNTTLTAPASHQLYNKDINPAYAGKINFNWGGGSPISGWLTNNFSITWRKGFYTTQKTTIQFDIPYVDDGVRIWLFSSYHGGNANVQTGGPGGCTTRSTAPTGTWNVYDDNFFSYNPATSPDSAIPTECLVVHRFSPTAGVSSRLNIRRTVPANTFIVIQIDYVEGSGSAGVTVNVTNSAVSENPDNTQVTSGGAVIPGTSSTALCDWGNVQNLDESDSPEYRWDEYVGGAGQPAGNRCYLELRGNVRIPDNLASPALTFWDLWDIQPGARVWVELANYDPNGDGAFVRSDLVWQAIPLHTGNTFNYNWTYQYIPIPPGLLLDATNPALRKIAIRFVIENASSAATNRWWVDTISIDTVDLTKTYYPAQTWNLNDVAQLKDFITTGHWALTDENRIGAAGMAFHESPARNYSKLTVSRTSSTTDAKDFRIHAIEWKGFIDLADPRGAIDQDTDTGKPLLTFFQVYNVSNLTGLEVQYTTDPYSVGDGANWQLVPGGQIVARTKTSSSVITLPEKVVIPLNTIGVNKFRLRFAMLVNVNANTTSGGWWIDEIRLEREDRPRFTNYPFHDPAEDPVTLNQWQILGTWDRANNGYAPAVGTTGYSYTDSLNGSYAPNQSSVFQLKYPFDFRMDTPENPRAPNCNLGALCDTGGPYPKPVKPMMTFWWWRDLGSGENFYVEWRRFTETEAQWKTIWAYTDRMTTQGASSRTATRNSLAWERVEIDLMPIMTAIATDDTTTRQEDDIMFRFRFVTNSSSELDGVYLDDIRFQERVEDVWYLWPTSESRTDSAGAIIRDASNNPIFGSGAVYQDSLEDNPKLFTGGWHFGGDWQAITWEQKDGLYAFHESNGSQSQPEPYNTGPVTNTPDKTYNVLEMGKIMDLRGVSATERPVLYFWTRWSLGQNDYASVQVAYENPALGPLCSGGYSQCYEHLQGYSEWTTIWEQTNSRNLTWTRQQIALDAYAKAGSTPGRRIRIRFVLDALDRNANLDGWYIDAITIRYFTERSIPISASQSFFDGARNLSNWIPEGKWGLDPELYRGSGGGPVNLGSSTWTYNYWSLSSSTGRCTGISSDMLTCANRFLSETGAARARSTPGSNHVVNPSGIAPNNTGIVLDINNVWGTGGPFGMTNTFVGRWELVTGTVGGSIQAGTYTFIVSSDEGVRMRYLTETAGQIPSPCQADDPPLCGQFWNIINNWTYHGRTVDMGVARFNPAGTGNSTGRYRLVVEYFENTGNAEITLATGSNSFSFSDSPKQGAGLLFPEIEAVPRSSSSLILNGAFDLRNAVSPFISFYSYYELGGIGRIEVTTDGGFTWTNAGLQGALAASNYVQPTWAGQYWDGIQLDRTGAAVQQNQSTPVIDFNWGGNPALPAWQSDTYSVRWRRQITLAGTTPLNFRTTNDDGVRLWLIQQGDTNDPNVGFGCPDGNGVFRRSGDATSNGGNATFTTGCLLIDGWRNGSNQLIVTRTLPAGTHWLQLDYYEDTGSASVRLEIFPAGFSPTTWGGTYMPSNGAWQQRIYDLTAYQGQPSVGLRFRLDRLSVQMAAEGRNPQNTTVQSPTDWYDGLWIVDVTVANQ